MRADRERTEREARLDQRARRRLWAAVAAVVVLIGLVGTLVLATVLSNKTRVALVTSGHGDAIDELLTRGMEQAAADLPIEIMDVNPPITDLALEYRRLGDAGVELIMVPAGLDLGELNDVAPDMPDVTFVSITPFQVSEQSNVVSVMFADEQAGFMAGAAAAAETKTGIVGFVGGTAFADVEGRRAGFEAGAAFVDPTVTILARHIAADGDFVRAFQRIDLGKAAADDLFNRGADVVYHAAGRSGLGVFQAAREHTEDTGTKHWGIGADSDQFLEVDTLEQVYVLTSALRKFDEVAAAAVRDFVNGELEPGVVRYTVADGGLDYSERGAGLSASVAESIDQAKADIIRGAVTVPFIPDGDILPPLEAPEPVGTIQVTYDGSGCNHRYDGPDTVALNESVRIVITNNSAVASWIRAFAPEFKTLASSLVADPGTTRTGYIVAGASSYEFSCGTETSSTDLMTIEVE